MHLLVLSAFRHVPAPTYRGGVRSLNAPFGAQCFPTRSSVSRSASRTGVSMHLLVLSAFRLLFVARSRSSKIESQCTFWCSVLSDGTWRRCWWSFERSQCTFWCSVLSDLDEPLVVGRHGESQCTFWCSVLSDLDEPLVVGRHGESQCTFWCSVLSDSSSSVRTRHGLACVSMHLLVLSAFRPDRG